MEECWILYINMVEQMATYDPLSMVRPHTICVDDRIQAPSAPECHRHPAIMMVMKIHFAPRLLHLAISPFFFQVAYLKTPLQQATSSTFPTGFEIIWSGVNAVYRHHRSYAAAVHSVTRLLAWRVVIVWLPPRRPELAWRWRQPARLRSV